MFPKMHLSEIAKEEKDDYQIKPMNCPFHIAIYKNSIRSYKNLPLRYTELGIVYRYEKSGVLHGLARVRGFTQDDAHIFCTPEQLETELVSVLKLTLEILKDFGFKDYDIYLSTRPEKYAGELKNWEKATKSLKYALEKVKLRYQIDPGEGVFYGPKIDIKIKDSLSRPWQCTTIQLDFNLPDRFNINYIDEKGKKKRPFMIHRALLGSIERFVGILIEHYAGAFPLWISPIQFWIIPVGSGHRKYAREIGEKLEASGFRYEVKETAETVSKKIREGEIQKIPYLLVVGDKEKQSNSVRIRERGKGDIGIVKLENFIKKTGEKIKRKE
ncbi:MAG: threonine--tRNA ligase [Candidatus Nealsonbacteria bacterium RBG_13_36_15]|uniref:Threonine--tRNA ligase n=1 Tax=Candidatus Nealsonbacteria bacterium RBG_13_36_15 TaxID=1801660 RepID=A0A1G2DXR0_9BACT|nr:MAG: threonine--tRNA ligase [Candidatus Nealsonbacteria bacterium RBG_13_36_15]